MKCVLVLVGTAIVAVLVLYSFVHGSEHQGLTISPDKQTCEPNAWVTFNCTGDLLELLMWLVNGSHLPLRNKEYYHTQTIGNISTLNISCLPELNDTKVSCMAANRTISNSAKILIVIPELIISPEAPTCFLNHTIKLTCDGPPDNSGGWYHNNEPILLSNTNFTITNSGHHLEVKCKPSFNSSNFTCYDTSEYGLRFSKPVTLKIISSSSDPNTELPSTPTYSPSVSKTPNTSKPHTEGIVMEIIGYVVLGVVVVMISVILLLPIIMMICVITRKKKLNYDPRTGPENDLSEGGRHDLLPPGPENNLSEGGRHDLLSSGPKNNLSEGGIHDQFKTAQAEVGTASEEDGASSSTRNADKDVFRRRRVQSSQL